MAKDIDTFADLITALGGPKALGETCGRIGNQALNFGHKAKRARGGKGSIDVKHWPAVIRAAQRRGLPIDVRDLVFFATGEWMGARNEGYNEGYQRHICRQAEGAITFADEAEIPIDVNWRGALLALAVLTGLGLIFALTIGG